MISYGNLSDAQLLQIYGFVEEHEGFTNPWNSVSIPVSTVDQVMPLPSLTYHCSRGSDISELQHAFSAVILMLLATLPRSIHSQGRSRVTYSYCSIYLVTLGLLTATLCLFF